MNEELRNINTATAQTDKKVLKIKLKIAERAYNFNINRGSNEAQDEQRLRKATGLINKEIEYWREKHQCPDSQDALSLAIMAFVLRMIDGTAIQDKISDLNVDLESYLRKHEKKI